MASVLKPWVTVCERHRILKDTEHVRGTVIRIVVLLGNSISTISTALPPRMVLRLPVLYSVTFPISLLLRGRSGASYVSST